MKENFIGAPSISLESKSVKGRRLKEKLEKFPFLRFAFNSGYSIQLML